MKRIDADFLIDRADEARAARAELDRAEREARVFFTDSQKLRLLVLRLDPPSEFELSEPVTA